MLSDGVKHKRTIYVILPVHNRASTTEDFVVLLKNQSCKNFKLLLIDDGCVDDTCLRVKKHINSKYLEIIHASGNLWWAGSLQKAYEWLMGKDIPGDDYVLIINDDVYIGLDFIENGIRLLESCDNTIWGATPYSLETKEKLRKLYKIDWDNFLFKTKFQNQEIDALTTRGLFLKIKDFKRIGGFYPKLIPHYLSDVEFTYRARQMGYTLCVSDSIKIYAMEEVTGIHHIKKYEFYDRVRFFFSKKNAQNPMHFVAFIFLRAPSNYYKIKSLLIVFKNSLKMLLGKRYAG